MKLLIIYSLEEIGFSEQLQESLKISLGVKQILIFEGVNQLDGIQYPYIEVIDI